MIPSNLEDELFSRLCDWNRVSQFNHSNPKEAAHALANYIQSQYISKEEVLRALGKDTNLSVASRGKEKDSKFFESKYFQRSDAKNELRQEIKKKLGL